MLHEIVRHRRDTLIGVFFPSLALVDQTVQAWRRQYGDGGWVTPVVVCSDDTVGAREDVVAVTDSEFAGHGARVVRDTGALAAILDEQNRRPASMRKPLVIFATYQSSMIVAEAQQECGVRLDIAIGDEAHKLATSNSHHVTDRSGRLVLESDGILAHKRLFATATPRVFEGGEDRRTRSLTQVGVRSMSDEALFGKQAFTLTLREAIEAGHLVDYRVHVLQFLDDDARDAHPEAFSPDALDPRDGRVRMALGCAALAHTIERLGATRVIAYLNSVERANEFAALVNNVGFAHADVITGDQPTSLRNKKIARLAAHGGVIANVACLSEGVDIPELDAIIFVDPRSSGVDIVQAVGRAIRKPKPGSTKTVGHIVIPVLAAPDDADDDQTLGDGYEPVWQVLAGLGTNDPRIVTTLNRWATEPPPSTGTVTLSATDPAHAANESAIFDVMTTRIETSEPATVTTADPLEAPEPGSMPASPSSELAPIPPDSSQPDTDDADIIELTWATSTTVAPQVDVRALVATARRNLGLRTVRLLDRDWDWNQMVEQLAAFLRAHGRFPSTKASNPTEQRLGRWLSKQRSAGKAEGRMSDTRRKGLDARAAGWDEGFDYRWQENANQFVSFVRAHGSKPSPSATDPHEKYLARWIAKNRRVARQRGGLDADRQRYLDAEVPGWDESFEDRWNENSHQLARFVRTRGRLPSVRADANELRLVQWLEGQRVSAKRGGITVARQQFLDREAPGWMTNVDKVQQWNAFAAELGNFYRAHGRWPSSGTSDPTQKRLAAWRTAQRLSARSDGGIDVDRRKFLDAHAPGWDKRPEQQWKDHAIEVSDFYRTHKRWPSGIAKECTERSLYGWLSRQRRLAEARSSLDVERREFLDANAPGWDATLDNVWMSKAQQLADFYAATGRWPVQGADNEEEALVAAWRYRQRRAAKRPGCLSIERRDTLDRLVPGWDVDGRTRRKPAIADPTTTDS